MNESRVEEVANKHGVPIEMIVRAIALERAAVTLQNRKLSPKLRELVAEFADGADRLTGDDR
jgi:hypothetical protein